MRRGQVSIEFLMVTSFAFLMLLPLFGMFYSNLNQIRDGVVGVQAQKAVDAIVDAANTVYYYGSPAKRTLKVYFPRNIVGSSVVGKSLILNVSASGGSYDVSASADVNLSGSVRTFEGVHVITVSASSDKVLIEDG